MKTKRTILFMAIAIVLMITGVSCSKSTSGYGKYYCWVLTWPDGSSMYIWNTEEYVRYLKLNHANVVSEEAFTYKKSTKYKTVEDCVSAGCYSSPWQ